LKGYRQEFLLMAGKRIARQGIGLVPLSTFARTEKGFDSGRKTLD
jgi:hypothetical protein